MTDANGNENGLQWSILELYEKRYNSLVKDYFILISVTLAFIVIFIYPFVSDFYQKSALTDLKSFLTLTNIRLSSLVDKNLTSDTSIEIENFTKDTTNEIEKMLLLNYFNSVANKI